MAWADRRILDLFGIDLPIVLAPMAGPGTAALAIAVSQAGGLGSLPCALMNLDQARAGVETIRNATSRPFNLNFFCHRLPAADPAREAAWRARLAPYYRELGLDPDAPVPAATRQPFDDGFCKLVEEFRPEVVSFHFGLPAQPLLARVKAAGAKVISSATTVAEAQWLEQSGCDAIIATGFEAGGHRATFLEQDALVDAMARQPGTFTLVPQVADAVKVPVIAAGGIADGRGVAAAMALGASAVQVGTAYLFCPEAKVPALHRAALERAGAGDTAVTTIFTGRPARGIVNRLMKELGPMPAEAPAFPLAGGALAPLRAKAEPQGSGDFMSFWSGQAAALAPRLPAGDLTRHLAAAAEARFAALVG